MYIVHILSLIIAQTRQFVSKYLQLTMSGNLPTVKKLAAITILDIILCVIVQTLYIFELDLAFGILINALHLFPICIRNGGFLSIKK